MSTPEVRDLGDVVTGLQRGQSYKSALVGEPGPYLLGLGTIRRNGGFRGDSLRTYGGPTNDKILLKPGDLYVSLKDMTHAAELLGAVAKVPAGLGKARLTQDTIRLEVNDAEVDRDYLYWVLRDPRYRTHCRKSGTGTTNLDLSRSDFLGYTFRCPDLGEQRAIAEVLGALDDKIAANDRLIETADELAEAEWRRAAHRAVRVASLKDLATLHYGKALPAAQRVPGDVAVFGSGGHTGQHNQALVDAAGVVVGRKGTVGAVYWAEGPHFPIDTTFYLEATSDVSAPYLFYALRRMRLGEMNSDSAVPGLNRDRAYAGQLRVPEPTDQARFNQAVRPLFTVRSQSRSESLALAQTRDTLLPLLMSGKVTVKDAEKSVEEVV